MRLLEAAIAEGNSSPQTMFYYANELYDDERFAEAAHFYSRYLEVEPEGPDRYWASVFLAESQRIIGDKAEAVKTAAGAIGIDPSRAEAYVTLGRVHFDANAWHDAIPLFIAATGAARPSSGFVRDGDYSHAPWDFLAVCLDKVDRVHDAIDAAKRAVQGNPDGERVRANLHWMIDRLEAPGSGS
jgi:tetratricopeptide (TPR) repeat protein